jgi:Tfp pilus assembly protein PilO
MNRTYIIQASIALLLLLVGIGVVVLGFLFISKGTKNVETVAATVSEKRQETLRVALAKAALPKLAESEALLDAHTVRAQDIVSFLGGLETQGKATGATIEVVSVSPEQATERPRLALSIKITGTFDAVERTLGTIEYGKYDAVVSSVTLEASKDAQAKSPTWTAFVVLSVATDTP